LAGPVELRPGWFQRADGDATRFQRRLRSQSIRDPVEPHKRETAAFRGRAERADLLCAGHDREARGRRELVVSNRHNAVAGTGAVLDPRNDLLADIAALVEIDAIELVHIG